MLVSKLLSSIIRSRSNHNHCHMLNVFLTVNTGLEVDRNIDTDLHFTDRFQRYIYGPTKRGYCGLPLLLNLMNDYGLEGSFFVESLFALKFGLQPLQEIVALISNAGHETQLLLHADWASQAPLQLFDEEVEYGIRMHDFTLEQQFRLIGAGLDLLSHAGSSEVNAFRAEQYDISRLTLKALAANDIRIDCSYNRASKAGISDILPENILLQPVKLDGVFIYPVSVFCEDDKQELQSLELTSCLTREFEAVLLHAVEHHWDSVVIIVQSHDLMTIGQQRLDPIMLRRFKKLCKFLSDHTDLFHVRGFRGLDPRSVARQPELLVSDRINRYLRAGERVVRRLI